MLRGDLVAAYNYLTAGQDWKMELASEVHGDGTSCKVVNSLFQRKGGKKYHEGSQTLEQVAWRSCKISIFADVQDSPGHGPDQPDLIRPVLSRELI